MAAANDDEGKGYSIWLVPREKEALEELSRLIKSIAEEYSIREFEPHVTLVGTILDTEQNTEQHIIEQTAALARRIRPYTMSFGPVGQSDIFFRALFARIQKTPEVLDANQKAREVFGKTKDPEYMPHLSLMYASGLPIETKDEIIRAYNIEDTLRRLNGFTVGGLSLHHTAGKVGEWSHVRDFELRPRRIVH